MGVSGAIAVEESPGESETAAHAQQPRAAPRPERQWRQEDGAKGEAARLGARLLALDQKFEHLGLRGAAGELPRDQPARGESFRLDHMGNRGLWQEVDLLPTAQQPVERESLFTGGE
jgi:hypothetical protein